MFLAGWKMTHEGETSVNLRTAVRLLCYKLGQQKAMLRID